MTDLNELFSRNPLKLTREDHAAIVDEMRKKRHLFQNGGGVGAKPKTTAKQDKVLKALDLDIKL